MSAKKSTLEDADYGRLLSFDHMVDLYRRTLEGDKEAIKYVIMEGTMAEVVASMTEKGQQFNLAQWDAMVPMVSALLDHASTQVAKSK